MWLWHFDTKGRPLWQPSNSSFSIRTTLNLETYSTWDKIIFFNRIRFKTTYGFRFSLLLGNFLTANYWFILGFVIFSWGRTLLFMPKLEEVNVDDLWIQHDVATCRTPRKQSISWRKLLIILNYVCICVLFLHENLMSK